VKIVLIICIISAGGYFSNKIFPFFSGTYQFYESVKDLVGSLNPKEAVDGASKKLEGLCESIYGRYSVKQVNIYFLFKS
jgi:hypothetical protein